MDVCKLWRSESEFLVRLSYPNFRILQTCVTPKTIYSDGARYVHNEKR